MVCLILNYKRFVPGPGFCVEELEGAAQKFVSFHCSIGFVCWLWKETGDWLLGWDLQERYWLLCSLTKR